MILTYLLGEGYPAIEGTKWQNQHQNVNYKPRSMRYGES